uniref:Uncharacterized protein n=1 Tax=Myotis myotis TaxID=51298 RepID=A0A7J7TTN5_MYOMY|nr:hypothetical protein mMyoMyo1_008938 [Myotis myotis]
MSDYLLRGRAVFGGHPSISREGTLDFQGLECDCCCAPYYRRKPVTSWWSLKEGKPSLTTTGWLLLTGRWQMSHMPGRHVGCHSHVQGCFIFFPLPAPPLSLSPFHLLPVRPWQVLKVMVTAERVALPDYSKEKDTLNYRK